ncbi:hypothetical protein BD324DRAFT_653928 [Kockovaella imperatae]|uniref:Transcriptional adapter 2 n=1 Tax=Kockovaella imperatae TaxID=4999 RepID=A0A1Y1U7Y2_9TREE|nr:hypothetical protein BD324DRAFT_653928 [Kockovaella imperatae]ORX33626.1 hypothetical protein BD324DRAFT_653928 [Kockovaella imperatae]
MTVTSRRVRSDPNGSGKALEPGIKATCDGCGVDVTQTVRIKCAAKGCEDVDICPNCFCEGKEFNPHKPWHEYKVVEQHSWPIFTEDWGADEELLLISGLIIHGLGNWIEVASHVGTRTKEECEKHYISTYIEAEQKSDPDSDRPYVKREFMPSMHENFDIDPDEFQNRKKARIEELRKPQTLPPAGPPMVSAPTNHEVSGFMPGRLEFEHEVDNEAEMAIKDLEFRLVYKYGGDEQPAAKVTEPIEEEDDEDEDEESDKEAKDQKPVSKNGKPEPVRVKSEPRDEEQPEASSSRMSGSPSPTKPDVNGKGKGRADPADDEEDEDELEIKLALLDIYFNKLDKRQEAKELLFDRGLTEHKRLQALDKKRARDERELVQRYKVFAKLQTAQDYETLIEGIIYEHQLRKRITELQEYRKMGITTGAEAEAYDAAKVARAGYRPLNSTRPEVMPTGARANAGQHRFLHGAAYGTPPPVDAKKHMDSREPTPRIPLIASRKPATPLNLANSASLDLLSTEEQSLCSSLRVLPKPYLTIKEMYIRENERRKGQLRRRDARKMMKIDVNKSGRIFDFLVSAGMLILSYDPSIKSYTPRKDGSLLGYGMELMNGVRGVVDIHTRDGELG